LALLDPPYVYNVFQGDRDAFVRAIKDAIDHPIQRFVDPIFVQKLTHIINVQLRAQADAHVRG
jgi:hypothetical protein